MRPPTLALIFAPMPSRLDLYFCEAEEEKDMPTVLSAIQWFPLRASLTNSIGGAFMLLITADMRPSFHKSTTATERLPTFPPAPAPGSRRKCRQTFRCRCCDRESSARENCCQDAGCRLPGRRAHSPVTDPASRRCPRRGTSCPSPDTGCSVQTPRERSYRQTCRRRCCGKAWRCRLRNWF